MAEPIEEFIWEMPSREVQRSMGYLLRRYENYIGLLRDHVVQLEQIISLDGKEVTIRNEGAAITLRKGGAIVIKANDIVIEATGNVEIKAARNVVIKGAKILQN